MNKVIITADSTCDLSKELKDRYNVYTYPLHIVLGDNVYEDSVNIQPEEIYDNFYKTKTLPKTAAINSEEYISYFKPFVDDGYEIVHINIGSALSACYQNCKIASEEFDGHVYPVDSCNLSTGTGLLVIEAAQLAMQGLGASEIAQQVNNLVAKSHASFILDRLDFMCAGGRCSTVAMLGANLLSLKPSIEVHNNENGKMTVGKKYRGKLQNVLLDYLEDNLTSKGTVKKDRAFITHAGISDEIISEVKLALESKGIFDEIFVTRASCTISSHCGPNTLGVLFMTE